MEMVMDGESTGHWSGIIKVLVTDSEHSMTWNGIIKSLPNHNFGVPRRLVAAADATVHTAQRERE